jgi:hypothetical protein
MSATLSANQSRKARTHVGKWESSPYDGFYGIDILASGILTILVAFYLWASFPVTAVWLLGVLLGVQLICEGAALGYLAWQVRTT